MLSEPKIENLKKKFTLVVSRDKMGLQTFPIVLLNLMAGELFGLLIWLKKKLWWSEGIVFCNGWSTCQWLNDKMIMNHLINVLRYLRYTKLIVHFFIQYLSIFYTGSNIWNHYIYVCVCIYIVCIYTYIYTYIYIYIYILYIYMYIYMYTECKKRD